MEIKSYNSKDNFIKINPYKEGVNTVPKKLTKIIHFANGSMVRIRKDNRIMYYNPKQKSQRSRRIIGAVCSLAIAVTLVGIFNPVIIQSFQKLKSSIELKNRPEQKELIENLIPNIDTPEIINNNEKNKLLDLSEGALLSVNNLKNKINNIFSKYSDVEGVLTPAFVAIDYDNQVPKSFILFCDLDKERYVSFEYLISDVENFENLTESNMEVTNIINGLSTCLNNRDLVDIPTIGRKLKINDTEFYATNIIEETEATNWNPLTLTYDFEEFYTFKKYYIKDTNLSEKKIKILKSDAEKLENFDFDNINCLYDIYLNDSTKFEKDSEFELGINPLSVILPSAKNINQKGNNLEQ